MASPEVGPFNTHAEEEAGLTLFADFSRSQMHSLCVSCRQGHITIEDVYAFYNAFCDGGGEPGDQDYFYQLVTDLKSKLEVK
ncbi:hypothetical protein EOL96_00395 [Candidatus Saccharibacteria bacterium]|nr:hypothetical protein [Candidatus Saccharibacteria bacterium]